MTRILHVTECDGGGVCRAMDLAASLLPQHEHYLAAPDVDALHSPAFADRLALPDGHVRRILALRRIVDRVRPDVIHAHSSWAGVYTRIAPGRIPVVYQPHCYAFEMDGRLSKIAYRTAERLLARNSAATVVLSQREARLALSLSPRGLRWFVPNVATIEPSATPSAPPDGTRRVVVMAGRISTQKDPLFFAEVATRARQGDPDLAFRWLGDGDPELRRGLEDAGVEVSGWLTDEQLKAELDRSWLYLHTARWEGFPLSVLDAASRGVPVAGRDIGVFDGTGLAVFRDVDEAVEIVLRSASTAGYRESLRGASTALMREMTPTSHAESLAALYARVTSVREAPEAAALGERWIR